MSQSKAGNCLWTSNRLAPDRLKAQPSFDPLRSDPQIRRVAVPKLMEGERIARLHLGSLQDRWAEAVLQARTVGGTVEEDRLQR